MGFFNINLHYTNIEALDDDNDEDEGARTEEAEEDSASEREGTLLSNSVPDSRKFFAICSMSYIYQGFQP